MSIKSFVFLDLETTGLPSYECNKTRITELCMIAIQAEHIRLGVYPRVQNKLTLCFNPLRRITPGAEEITGLYNDALQNESSFNEASLNIITNFLERLAKPICLVAHNGNNFDFPIFQTHITAVNNTFPQDVLCIDTLLAFKEIDLSINLDKPKEEEIPQELLDNWDDVLCDELTKIENSISETCNKEVHTQQSNETTPRTKIQCEIPGAPKAKQPQSNSTKSVDNSVRRRLDFNTKQLPKKLSYKLSDYYERTLQKAPTNLHHAEGDVIMMLECAVTLGDIFVDYAENTAILFNQIPKMEPGKKIGLPRQ